MFKGLSQIAGLMKNARDIQARAAEMKDKLASIRVEGASGGGMITVVATGDQKIISCRIEPSLLVSPDAEVLEDLIVAACNQALDKAKAAAAEQMQSLAGGLDIPGLDETMKNLGLGS
ncbi:MAG: YbaB/EbfC family nucleoid-associated protein [Planctomycetaceae bacterium]